MQIDTRLLPPDYHPGSSFIWLMLGLAVFDFLLFVVSIYAVAVLEERKMRMKERHKESQKASCINPGSRESGPGSRKLGACRDEIWIAEDFDAPLILVEDCKNRNSKKR